MPWRSVVFISLILLLLVLAIPLFAGATALGAYWALAPQLPPVTDLQAATVQRPLRIFARNGELLAEFALERREPVTLKQVPPQLLQAFLATEDRRFLDHRGVDLRALLRAALHLARTGSKAQGGSTITMQLARNQLLSPEKTYRRKLLEILLALQIEQELSKAEIMELYLNSIFLGHRAYGIAAAAQVYYGVELNELTLAQAAMLAGIAQTPSLANPITAPQRAKQRRDHVLRRMLNAGFISFTDYQSATSAPLTAQLQRTPPDVMGAGHFSEMVRLELAARYPDDVYTRGLNVYTSLDATLQRYAVTAVREGLLAYDQRHGTTRPTSVSQPIRPDPAAEAALIALHPGTGAIRAWIGGFDFGQSQFNRAVQAKRQPGSAFKPLLYAIALDQGFSPASIINDAPISIPDGRPGRNWQPRNFSGRFYGPTRLREALTWSRNIPSVRLLEQVGVPEVRETLATWGLPKEQLPEGLSLALGSATLSPLQLTSAYAVFASGGRRIQPWFIERIEDASGRIMMARLPEPDVQILPEAIAYQVTDILGDVIRRGTGRRAQQLGRRDLAGKTGTTNDYRDAWFSGYNRHLLTTVWVGFDDNRSLGHGETGASAALPIWLKFMAAALNGQPETHWQEPEGLTLVRIDAEHGGPAGPHSRQVVTEALTERQQQQWAREYAPRTRPAAPEQYHPMQIF